MTIHLYIAASLDGYIAAPDGGIDWLRPFETEDYGFADFLGRMDAVVMGRLTYEQARGFAEWPYTGKRSIVLSSQPLLQPMPQGIEHWQGDIPTLAGTLAGEAWVVGGAKLVRGFLEAGCIDRIELYVVPLLLGHGIPLFERGMTSLPLRTEEPAKTFPNGVVRLAYALAE
jgi:dihydrofolate reductase